MVVKAGVGREGLAPGRAKLKAIFYGEVAFYKWAETARDG
jgi:hypothetical protein